MKRTALYLPLLLIGLVNIHCSQKKDDPIADPPATTPHPCVVKNYVGVKDGVIVVSDYLYNTDKQLTEEVYYSPNDVQYIKKIYAYNDKGQRLKLTTESYARDDVKQPFKLIQTIYRTYEYDTEGRCIKAVDSYGSQPALYATYNAQNQLVKITGNVEGANYLWLTYNEQGDMVKVERINEANPAVRITLAEYQYDTSRPAQILPEQKEVLHGLEFLVQKHLCKRVSYFSYPDSKPVFYFDFKLYKRTDMGKPEWDWVDVTSDGISRTYSLEYDCK